MAIIATIWDTNYIQAITVRLYCMISTTVKLSYRDVVMQLFPVEQVETQNVNKIFKL